MSDSQDKQAPQEFMEELLSTGLPDAEILSTWHDSPHDDDEALTRELMDLLNLRSELDRDAKEVRSVLGEAVELPDTAGSGAVGSFFAERLGAGTPRPSSWAGRLRALALLSGAAAALLLVLWWRDRPAPGPDPGPRMGSEKGLELLAPKGRVAGFEGFRWSHPAPTDGWFELVLRDAEGNEFERITDLSGTGWNPTLERAAEWPYRIEWELQAFDSDGRTGAWSAAAWRD